MWLGVHGIYVNSCIVNCRSYDIDRAQMATFSMVTFSSFMVFSVMCGMVSLTLF